jgi:hypothetical protein
MGSRVRRLERALQQHPEKGLHRVQEGLEVRITYHRAPAGVVYQAEVLRRGWGSADYAGRYSVRNPARLGFDVFDFISYKQALATALASPELEEATADWMSEKISGPPALVANVFSDFKNSKNELVDFDFSYVAQRLQEYQNADLQAARYRVLPDATWQKGSAAQGADSQVPKVRGSGS